MSQMVWAEVNFGGYVERIVRGRKTVTDHPVCRILRVERALAVNSIRRQIVVRSDGECEICAAPVTESSGNMHEKVWRGKGGEISLANSIFICRTCHHREHKSRNPRFSKKEKYERNQH